MTPWPAEVAGTDLGETVAITAAPPGRPPGGGKGEEFGKSSPVGLLVIVLLAIAVVLLIRSMTKHLKKVPASFESDKPSEREPDGETAESALEPEDRTEQASTESVSKD